MKSEGTRYVITGLLLANLATAVAVARPVEIEPLKHRPASVRQTIEASNYSLPGDQRSTTSCEKADRFKNILANSGILLTGRNWNMTTAPYRSPWNYPGLHSLQQQRALLAGHLIANVQSRPHIGQSPAEFPADSTNLVVSRLSVRR